VIEDKGAAARLTLWPDAAPAALNVEALTKVIQDKGIVLEDGLPSVLQKLLAQFASKPGKYDAIVAKAVPAVNGDDGSVLWQPGCDPQAPTGQSKAEGNKIDFYNQARYIAVTAGMHIATIHAPTPGTSGRDITGKVLKAAPGKPCQFKCDPSVKVETDGKVTAGVDGILQSRDGFIKVLPMFEIPGAVDFSTGNIMFKGCVVIRGDVRDRFIVRADQDVTVHGLIGAATIICGRNFFAHCGMAAHEHGCLFVGGDAQVGYLKNGHGLINGSLLARRELINCDLAIGRDVVCDASSVIGGTLAIGGKAIIGTLGSPTCAATTIIFGTHPCQQEAARTFGGAPAENPTSPTPSAEAPTPATAAPGAAAKAPAATAAPAAKSATTPGAPPPSATAPGATHPGATHPGAATKPAGTPPAAPAAQSGPPKQKQESSKSKSPDKLNDQVAKFAEQVRACVSQSNQFASGTAKPVDLTVQKFLHPGVTIRTGRCRIALDKPIKGPIRIHGDQDRGLFYQIGAEGVSHPLTDLARPMDRAG